MATISAATTKVEPPSSVAVFDEAELAAASFLARYGGRTIEAYRHDQRGFFQRAADHGIAVLVARRCRCRDRSAFPHRRASFPRH